MFSMADEEVTSSDGEMNHSCDSGTLNNHCTHEKGDEDGLARNNHHVKTVTCTEPSTSEQASDEPEKSQSEKEPTVTPSECASSHDDVNDSCMLDLGCLKKDEKEPTVTPSECVSSHDDANDSCMLDMGCLKKDEKEATVTPSECASSHDDVNDSCMLDLGCLKKDDSGIAVDQSSVHGDASPDCDTIHIDDSGCVANDNHASTSPPVPNVLQKLMAAEEDSQGAFRNLLPSDSDSDDDHINGEHTPGTRKRRRSRRLSCSDSSTSTSEASNQSDDKSDSDDDNEDGMDTDSEPVKDRWHPMLELRRREVGLANHLPAHMLFRQLTSSSLQLVQRLQMQTKLQHHDGCVNALHFNKAGTLLASGSDDLNVVLWDWMSGQPYLAYDSGHRSNVFQAKFMPYTGDCHVVSCARDGQVRLAELSSTGICKSTKKLAQHRGSAHKLAMLQDSSHVFYSCGEDAAVYEVDLRCDKPNKLCTVEENDKKVSLYSIHANPFKSHEFCLGGRDHFIRIYDKRMLEGGKPLKKYCPHHLLESEIKANVTCAVYNYNGTEVLGTYNDEDIYLFDNYHSDGAEFVKRYQGHRNNATVKGVNFYGPKSEYVISGSDCGHIFIWDKDRERIVQYFHGDEGGVINVLEPHPHHPILATSGLDHDVKIWTPTAETSTKLTGLRKTTKRNLKERDEERINEPDMIDGQMLWFFMQQLRRTARRSGQGDGTELSASSSNTDSDDNDDEDSDTRAASMQCTQS